MNLLVALGLKKPSAAELAPKLTEARAGLERAVQAFEADPTNARYDEVEAARRSVGQLEVLHAAAARREAEARRKAEEAARAKELARLDALEAELKATKHRGSEALIPVAERFVEDIAKVLSELDAEQTAAAEKWVEADRLAMKLGRPRLGEVVNEASGELRIPRPRFAGIEALRGRPGVLSFDSHLGQAIRQAAAKRPGDPAIAALRAWGRG